MKRLGMLLIVMLMASSAFAVIDPDPNMMGLYFDLNADTNSFAATVNVPFMAYLMLTNPTYADVSGFEAGYEVVVPAGMEGLYFRLNEDLQGGLNVAVGNTALLGEYVVGWPAPRTTSAATVLVAWQMMLIAPMQVEVFLGPSNSPSVDNGLPALEIGGSIVSLGLSTGGAEIPVARVNGAGPIAEEFSSFGGVKALFR